MFRKKATFFLSVLLVSCINASFAIEAKREEASNTSAGSSATPVKSILTLKSTSIDPVTGMQLKTYSGKTKRASVRGKMFSGLKRKLIEDISCIPAEVVKQCAVDKSKTHSSHTRHGDFYGKGGPGYGIFITDINTHGSNYDKLTRYKLTESASDICLESKVYVSSKNKRRGWYEQNHEVYLKCGKPNPDFDNDGILNSTDNCQNTANADQANTDSDRLGDACDNCVAVSNQNQLNSDGDNYGNACDLDDDGDGIEDSYDNCPLVRNPTQSDVDNDGIGDSCDPQDDNAPYDLAIEKQNFIVISDCFECSSVLDANAFNFLGGQIPLHTHKLHVEGGGATIMFNVTNMGKTKSESVDVKFYLSKGHNSIAGLQAHNSTVRIPALSPGQSFRVNSGVLYTDFYAAEGIYYIVVDLEGGGNDGNLQNNTLSFPIKIVSIWKKGVSIKEK